MISYNFRKPLTIAAITVSILWIPQYANGGAYLVGNINGDCPKLPGATVDEEFGNLYKRWGSKLEVIFLPQTDHGNRWFFAVGHSKSGIKLPFFVADSHQYCMKTMMDTAPPSTKSIIASAPDLLGKQVLPRSNPASLIFQYSHYAGKSVTFTVKSIGKLSAHPMANASLYIDDYPALQPLFNAKMVEKWISENYDSSRNEQITISGFVRPKKFGVNVIVDVEDFKLTY